MPRPLGGDAQRHLVRRRHVMLLPRLSLHVATVGESGSSVALVAGSQFEIGEKMGVQNTPAKRAIRALTSPLPSPNVACPRVILGDAVVTHYKNPINK